MKTKQRRPGPEGGVYVSAGAKTTTTIQATTDALRNGQHQLTGDLAVWDAYTAGYAAGYGVGPEHGHQAAENNMAPSWATVAQCIRRRASMLSHAELVTRRAG